MLPASILPSTEEMASALVPLREAFGDLSRDILSSSLAEFGPAIREGVLVGVALSLVNQLTALARVVAGGGLRAFVPCMGHWQRYLRTDEENRTRLLGYAKWARPGGVATGKISTQQHRIGLESPFGGHFSRSLRSSLAFWKIS